MPPMPKRNPARRNVSATKSTLTRDHTVTAPDLPDRETGWHHLTAEWWADIWASPMAPEFDSSDIHGLFVLADLVNSYWCEPSAKARSGLAAEIRLQRQCFGLTPIDRRRLQWEISRGDEAEERTAKRRSAAKKEPVADPRAVLRLAQ
jgi:hypothetical protein